VIRAVVVAAMLFVCGVAQADDTLAVVIRVDGAEDEAIARRVRGQTSDLDVDLTVVEGRLEPTLAAQVEAAGALAEEQGARVIVWFDEGGGGTLLVHVAAPASGRVLVRRIPSGGRSASRETAAVVVRSALRALAAGGEIGVAAAQAVAEAEAASPTPPPPPRDVDRVPAVRSRARVGFSASLGWQIAIDGESPAGQQGLAARIGGSWRAISLELFVAASLPSRLSDPQLEIDLARHAAGAALSLAIVGRPRLRVSIGVLAGVIAWSRTTVSTDPELVATDPRVTPTFFVGPEARAQIAFGRSSPIALELVAGADVVPTAPELVTEGNDAVVGKLWYLQPRLGLSLVVRTP
jgi:hypothetical protein